MSLREATLHGGVAVAYIVGQDVRLTSDYAVDQKDEMIPCMAQVFSYCSVIGVEVRTIYTRKHITDG